MRFVLLGATSLVLVRETVLKGAKCNERSLEVMYGGPLAEEGEWAEDGTPVAGGAT
jgi:hypothetical protein